MNRLLVRTTLLAGALALAASASHALPFSGSFTFQFGTYPPLTFAASGSGASVGDVSTGGIVPGTETVPITANAPVTQIEVVITGNGTGSLPGPLSVRGRADFLGSGLGISLAQVPLFTTQGQTANGATGVTAGVGVGNTIQTTGAGGTIIQVFNEAWTTGTATLQLSRTPEGSTDPTTATATGGVFGNRLVVVAPVAISPSVYQAGNLPSFAVLDLTYVPEPGTLLLLGSGVAALGALGGRRLRG